MLTFHVFSGLQPAALGGAECIATVSATGELHAACIVAATRLKTAGESEQFWVLSAEAADLSACVPWKIIQGRGGYLCVGASRKPPRPSPQGHDPGQKHRS